MSKDDGFLKVKVFSATMAKEREVLGERATAWMQQNKIAPKKTDVLQSSDESFHCLSLVIWYE